MKMKQADFKVLQDAIKPFDTVERRELYRHGQIVRYNNVHNLDKRYRWDLLYLSNLNFAELGLYDYLNDKHIDTALKAIVPSLTV